MFYCRVGNKMSTIRFAQLRTNWWVFTTGQFWMLALPQHTESACDIHVGLHVCYNVPKMEDWNNSIIPTCR